MGLSLHAFWRPRRSFRTTAILAVLLLALVYPPGQLAAASPNGGPAATRPAPKLPIVRSTPPRKSHAAGGILPGESVTLPALPAGYSLVDPVVSNTDPNLMSTDQEDDSEPSLAVDGGNPNHIVISSFRSDESWPSSAPLFQSLNGGATWSRESSVPPPVATSSCPCDQVIDFDRSSRVIGTFLNRATIGWDDFTGSTTDVGNANAWGWTSVGGSTQTTEQPSSNSVDQPWVRVNRDPGNANQDDTYVVYDDFTASQIRVAASFGYAVPYFTRIGNVAPTTLGINPGARLVADHRNGTMYVIYQFLRSQNGGTSTLEYDINRSTDGGQTWALNGSSTGIVAATANSDQFPIKFGHVNALIGGVDSAAVDPTQGDVYYVYGAKDPTTGKNRLAIVGLTTDGSGGMNVGIPHFVTGQVEAALPSVGVAANGTIGILYDTFDRVDVNNYPVFSAHLAQSTDHGVTFSDVTLLTFRSPLQDNGDDHQRVLGDYQLLRVLGNTFYGTFTGDGAAFGRSTHDTDPIFVKAPALAPAGTKPTAPGNVVASPLSPPAVRLSWTDSAGETSYDIYRWNGATSAWDAIAHPAANSTTFTDTGLAPATTYYHYVCAANAAGSTCSASYSTTTTPNDSKPTAPTNVAASAISATSIGLTWTDSAGETSYDVYRWSSATAAWVPIAHPAQNSTGYTDTGLSAGVTYYHLVCATNSIGSACAAYTTATTLAKPTAPTNFSATPASSSAIDLHWTAASGQTGYTMYRWNGATSAWVAIGTLEADQTAFTDNALAPGITYYHLVCATNSAGPTCAASYTTATTPASTKPTAPGALTGKALSASSVGLYWADAIGESSYDVYRWNGATSSWVVIGHPAQNATSFTDAGLAAGTTYYHYICATNSSGSTCSASYVTTTTLTGAKPSAPTGLAATPLSTTSIGLTWTDAAGETVYDVYRWNGATSSWVAIAHPAAGSTVYTDSGLAPGTTYYHYVCATNAYGSTCAAGYTTATTPS